MEKRAEAFFGQSSSLAHLFQLAEQLLVGPLEPELLQLAIDLVKADFLHEEPEKLRLQRPSPHRSLAPAVIVQVGVEQVEDSYALLVYLQASSC